MDQKVRTAFIIFALPILAAPLALFILSTGTRMQIVPAVPVIGETTPMHVIVFNPHGVRKMTTTIEQDGRYYLAQITTSTPHRFMFLRRHEAPQDLTILVGKKAAPALHDGKAKIIIEAQSNDLRAATDTVTADVDVITAPPRVVADGARHYINQGGCGLVAFTPTGYWTDSGVRVGKYTFRSFPLPSDPGKERFSLFAYPWDLPADVRPSVYATNPAGGIAAAAFSYKVFPKRFRTRDIEIDDAFLEKVDNQIEPGSSGDLLERFLRINRDLRRKNNQTLADLRLQTAPKFYWSGPFLQLGNSQVESVFADRRNYIYKGKKVDEQVHLGFDLAVTAHVAVPASNDGKVLWASDLGIYGNCVAIDHGYGLQSIYGHLSRIGVKLGDMVKKGQMIGRSGSTGLAGGDHLHFSMQLDGVQVNPVEWWDEQWIEDRVLSRLSSR
ncbi:MAG: M23 family metallopeptidase [Bryobacteraceae bacterium]